MFCFYDANKYDIVTTIITAEVDMCCCVLFEDREANLVEKKMLDQDLCADTN